MDHQRSYWPQLDQWPNPHCRTFLWHATSTKKNEPEESTHLQPSVLVCKHDQIKDCVTWSLKQKKEKRNREKVWALTRAESEVGASGLVLPWEGNSVLMPQTHFLSGGNCISSQNCSFQDEPAQSGGLTRVAVDCASTDWHAE